jgi:hypothetical protein
MQTRIWRTDNPRELQRQLAELERRVIQLGYLAGPNGSGLLATSNGAKPGYVLSQDSTGAQVWIPAWDQSGVLTRSHEFLTLTSSADVTLAAYGAGQIAIATATAGFPGAADIQTAAVAAASGYRATCNNSFILASGFAFECIFKTPAAFTSGTAANVGLWLQAGFHALNAYSAVPGQGVYVRYDSTGALSAYIDDGAATTGALATLAASTWYQCRIEITDTGALFTLYSGSTGEVLADIGLVAALPTGATRLALIGGTIAADVGFLTATTLTVDYIALITPRGNRLEVAS